MAVVPESPQLEQPGDRRHSGWSAAGAPHPTCGYANSSPPPSASSTGYSFTPAKPVPRCRHRRPRTHSSAVNTGMTTGGQPVAVAPVDDEAGVDGVGVVAADQVQGPADDVHQRVGEGVGELHGADEEVGGEVVQREADVADPLDVHHRRHAEPAVLVRGEWLAHVSTVRPDPGAGPAPGKPRGSRP